MATCANAGVTSGTGWSFDEDTGVLEITGDISSDGSVDSANAPWAGQVTPLQIYSINFGEGVTRISGFINTEDCDDSDDYCNINSVSFPSTLKTIDSGSFQNNASLYSITFDKNATGLSIGDDAFINLSSVSLSGDFLPDNTSIGQNVFNYFNDGFSFSYTKDDNGVYKYGEPPHYYSSADRMFSCLEGDCIEEGCETAESCAAVVAVRNVSTGGTDNGGAGGSGNGDNGGNVNNNSGSQSEPKRIYTVEEARAAVEAAGTDTVNFRIRYK